MTFLSLLRVWVCFPFAQSLFASEGTQKRNWVLSYISSLRCCLMRPKSQASYPNVSKPPQQLPNAAGSGLCSAAAQPGLDWRAGLIASLFFFVGHPLKHRTCSLLPSCTVKVFGLPFLTLTHSNGKLYKIQLFREPNPNPPPKSTHMWFSAAERMTSRMPESLGGTV